MADAYKPMRDVVKDATLLAQKRKEVDSLRRDDLEDWALNTAFYNGDQWAQWSRSANRLETLPVDDGDKPRYKVRLVANQISPGVNHYVAQLTKTRPIITATPDSGSDKDVKAAQMAERLYDYWWREQHLKSKLISALVHAQLSQGYWWIGWDEWAGKQLRFMLNPETGEPILQEDLADAFRDELANENVDAALFEKVIYVGDISVKVKSGADVWVDPTVSEFEDAGWAVVREHLSPDDVKARYGVAVEPDTHMEISGGEVALAYTFPGRASADKKPKNVRAVYHGFFRPTPALPKGRHVVWVEGPNKIIAQGDWDFPVNALPLIKFPGVERPGSVLDEPRTNQARPLQKDLNRLLSQIREWTNLAVRPQMLAPAGSLRQKLTTEPGAIFEFNPIAGMAPEWRPTPNLPGSVFEQLIEVQNRINQVYNRVPTERGNLPARIDAGTGIELIYEAIADQMSNEVIRLEEALARAGDMMAALAKRNYIEPRLLKIVGTGGGVQVKKFMNSDIEGGFTFHAEAGTGLPKTRAGRQTRIMELAQSGIIPPHQAWKYLDIADLKGLATMFQADEDMAYREHERLIKGEPINVGAAEEAVTAIQSGVNPMSGQPFQSEDEVRALLETSALSPLPYENSASHLDIHALYMKSLEFEQLPPETQQRFMQHYQMTLDALNGQQSGPEPDAPKVSLSLKGSIGPTGAAAILNKSGVPVDADVMKEEPLATSIYDSLDQVDVDSAGNDPLTEEERLMDMQHKALKQNMEQVKLAADTALAYKRAVATDQMLEDKQ